MGTGLMSPTDWYNMAYNTGMSGVRGQEEGLKQLLQVAQVSKLMRDLRREQAANQAMASVNPFKESVQTDYSKTAGGLIPAEVQEYAVPDQSITRTQRSAGEMTDEAASNLEGRGLFTEARTLRKSHAEDTKAHMENFRNSMMAVRQAQKTFGRGWREVLANDPNPSIRGLADMPLELNSKGDTVIKDPRTGLPAAVITEVDNGDGKMVEKVIRLNTPADYQNYLLANGDPEYMKFMRDRKQAITVSTGGEKRDRVQALTDDDGNVTVVNLDRKTAEKVEGARGKTAKKKSKRSWSSDTGPTSVVNPGNTGQPKQLTYDPRTKTFK